MAEEIERERLTAEMFRPRGDPYTNQLAKVRREMGEFLSDEGVQILLNIARGRGTNKVNHVLKALELITLHTLGRPRQGADEDATAVRNEMATIFRALREKLEPNVYKDILLMISREAPESSMGTDNSVDNN